MALKVTVPPRLQRGDAVRVIAPARSRSFVTEHDHSDLIEARFNEMGLRLTFADHVDERDEFDSSAVASRVDDLHAAFADPDVSAVLTVIGGFNSNELLPHLDWDLIAAHPKIFCGYSDITALQNAVLARTGVVTYSGPHWSSFGMREHFEPTGEWFRQALFTESPITLRPAESWTDDLWFLDQDRRTPRPNEGWWPLRTGRARGRTVGGNLSTLCLLQGTAYMPSLDGAVLFLEDDAASDVPTFCRHLTSILQLPDAQGVEGVVIGRFQVGSGMTRSLLTRIIERQPALSGRPVLANVDFGHTNPIATIPIGGTADLTVGASPHLTLAHS
jgi:muramoyltetrapeptide carboxypeptidase LdcA involved in peptidoglycan recycling